MTTNHIAQLINKLNEHTKRALGVATNDCAQDHCYQVEIEHWLLCLINDEYNDMKIKLASCGINVDLLIQDINQRCQTFKKGNTQLPTLSPILLNVIESAWSIASIEHQQNIITPLHIIAALFSPDHWGCIAERLSNELSKLDRAMLKTLISDIKPHEDDINNLMSKNDSLSKYTIDLTQRAAEDKFDPIIGRDHEIRQLIDVLSRRRQNNPILVGDSGVGKTAIVEGLAQKIIADDVPNHLKMNKILSLDLTALQAGASVKGEFERRLKSLLDEIQQCSQPIILFIDETHNLIGAGNQTGQADAANLLKPALARGEIRVIGATTWSEYKKYIEPDAAFTRRFQLVKVNEPDDETAVKMLYGLANNLEKYHNINILSSALLTAVTLSRRYITGQQLPEKAISLLDTACARVSLSQTIEPLVIEKLKSAQHLLKVKIKRLENESKNSIVSDSQLNELYKEMDSLSQQLAEKNTEWKNAKQLINKVAELRKQLEKPDLSASDIKKYKKELVKLQASRELPDGKTFVYDCVDTNVIAEVVSDWTGIPTGKMLRADADKLLSLNEQLAERVIGQRLATDVLANHLQTNQANLQDPNKPRGVFLLVGSSGVGKTQTAQALADLLYGGREHMITINMSEFKEPHKISMLTGSPPGYVGFGNGGMLTEAVRRQPYSVILLDEMEKAHISVQELFYQVFDQGMLMDGEGRQIDFKNTLILMTSNACDRELIELTKDKKNHNIDELRNLIMPHLLNYFKAAFLGRVSILPYMSLNQTIIKKIATMKLAEVSNRFKEHHHVGLEFSSSIINEITRTSYTHHTGARQIDQYIQQKILPSLARHCLELVVKGGKPINLLVKNSKRGAIQLTKCA